MLDEKLTSRVFRLYSHKLHKQRLNDIKSKISTRINNSVPRTLKYQQIKRSGYASQTRERKTNINRENEKIFQMISQISDGKRASSIYSMCESLKATPKPKSLNMTSRKKEAQRIVEDNYALAKRLSESTRGVSFKRFDDEWQNTTKYMNSISKRNIRKLPKLDELNKYMHSVPSSDIGSKKVITLKSPVNETYKNSFSPNFNGSLPGSVLEVANEDKDTPKANQNILKKELLIGEAFHPKGYNDNKVKNRIIENEKSLDRIKNLKDDEIKNQRLGDLEKNKRHQEKKDNQEKIHMNKDKGHEGLGFQQKSEVEKAALKKKEEENQIKPVEKDENGESDEKINQKKNNGKGHEINELSNEKNEGKLLKSEEFEEINELNKEHHEDNKVNHEHIKKIDEENKENHDKDIEVISEKPLQSHNEKDSKISKNTGESLKLSNQAFSEEISENHESSKSEAIKPAKNSSEPLKVDESKADPS